MRTQIRTNFLAAALLLAGLVLLLGLVAPGVAQAAPSSLTAEQIDIFLFDNSSPMVGSGATFVAAGARTGVDPAFLVAVTGAESGFGQYLYSVDGDLATFNAFNWFYARPWPASDFVSWTEAIDRVAAGIAGPLYYGDGRYSVLDIAPRYCPDGTAAWIDNVTSFMLALGGDPADTRLVGGVVVDQQPATTELQPAALTLLGDVRLSRWPHETGRRMIVRFDLINSGDVPGAWQNISLDYLDPAGAVRSLTAPGPFNLEPGKAQPIAAAILLDQAGAWRGSISAQAVGDTARFTVAEAFNVEARVSLMERRPQLVDSQWVRLGGLQQ